MENKTYSKTKLKIRRIVTIVIVCALLVLLSFGVFLLVTSIKNYVNYGNVSEISKDVSDNIAKSGNPIIVNNVLVGAVKENNWISAQRYFTNLQSTTNLDLSVNMYTKNGKKATYGVSSFYNDKGVIFTSGEVADFSDEYIATVKSNTNIMPSPANDVEVESSDLKYIKKALGIYKLYNSSVKVQNAYSISITSDVKGKIFVITNEAKKGIGSYSAVVFLNTVNNKAYLIKYSYVMNLKDSKDWPLYSFKFIADIDEDGINEIVLQETKEENVSYDIISYNDAKFTQILTTEFTD